MLDLRFPILIIVAILNAILGIIILKKNNTKNRALNYFSLMCFSATLWTICIFVTLFTKNSKVFIISDRLIYFFTTLIINFFLLFSIEFPYRIYKYTKFLKIFFIIINTIIIYLIFSKYFITGHYYKNDHFYQLENAILNLFYGTYFLMTLIFSYSTLIIKYQNADGVNKKILKSVIIITLVPYLLGMIFGWFFPYIGMHYLHWLGAAFSMLMNIGMFYILFKKN